MKQLNLLTTINIMKASELIKKLEKLTKDYSDIEVEVYWVIEWTNPEELWYIENFSVWIKKWPPDKIIIL